MADFDFKEMSMLTRWYGTPDLVHNETFWEDCLKTYEGKVVTLPYDDTPEQRRELAPQLNCQPEECGACPQGEDIPITPDDYKRMSGNIRKHVNWKIDICGGRHLDVAGGCQFLENGACAVKDIRPAFCNSYPIVEPRVTISPEGTVFKQLQIKISCRHALEVVKLLMCRACAGGKLMLLPDLSIIPTYEQAGAMFMPENQEPQHVC